MTMHMPHVLGTSHHKPIDSTSTTQRFKEPNEQLADETAKLQEKASQPHSHGESAALNAKTEQQRTHSASDSTHLAAVIAARSVSKLSNGVSHVIWGTDETPHLHES